MRMMMLLLLAMMACGTGPTPTPTPTPTPMNDPFAGIMVDCGAPEPTGEAPQAEAGVRECLLGQSVAPCLIKLSGQYRVDTIACVVRILGESSNYRVLSETAVVDDSTIDNSARGWIELEHLGYRSVRQ